MAPVRSLGEFGYALAPFSLNPQVRAAVERAARGLGHAWIEIERTFAWLATKTGFPMLVVAAAALVIAWRLAKKLGRIAVEFALALVVLVALQKLGFVHW